VSLTDLLKSAIALTGEASKIEECTACLITMIFYASGIK
jgi:hypothetical protein